MAPSKQTWSSQWGFLVATASASVGLGNIWKFPYITGENGGGAFVLLYLICVALIGLPIIMVESLIGRAGKHAPIGAIETLCTPKRSAHRWKYLGTLSILTGYLVFAYYAVIAGWAVDYTVQSAMGSFSDLTLQSAEQHFNQLLADPWRLLLWDSVIILVTIIVVALGVQRGLEPITKLLFPAIFGILLLLIIYSVSVGYFFNEGLSFYMGIDFSEVSIDTVLIALGQAFFSLGLAMGVIMTYGAYLPKGISIPRSSCFIALADTLVAIVAGFAIFPFVFAFGLEPTSGPKLIFETLPLAFSEMPYGSVIATLFFLMLVFAAFTSAIAFMEPITQSLHERLGWSRRKSILISGIGVWILSIGTILSFNHWNTLTLWGKDYFHLLDYLTANIMLPAGGFFLCVYIAFRVQPAVLQNELDIRSKQIIKLLRFHLGYIVPAGILIIVAHSFGWL